MEINIEIGSSEQKELIASEFEFVRDLCEQFESPPSICGIWVADDFDKTVNELQGTNNYTSNRGHVAIAKNVYVGDETALVFSKILFTEFHDNHTRLQFILHELCHTLNKMNFPKTEGQPAYVEYLSYLYTLFDEYWANRWSFEITEQVFGNVSPLYKKLTRSSTFGFLRGIIEIENDYSHIKSEIFKFRFHGNVVLFMGNIRRSVDEILKSLVYFYSYFHHYKKYSKLESFIDVSTDAGKKGKLLVEFFRQKYENNDVNIFDGILIIEELLKCFGFQYEDQDGGLCIKVLNI